MHAPGDRATRRRCAIGRSIARQPVAAGYRPAQLPAVSDASPTSQSPQVNPYLPTTGDAASGYSSSQVTASQYAGSSQFATNAEPPQPAAVPSDPTAVRTAHAAPQPAEQTDAAPQHRHSPPSLSPLNQSPYAAAVTVPAACIGRAFAPPSRHAADDPDVYRDSRERRHRQQTACHPSIAGAARQAQSISALAIAEPRPRCPRG